jgi:hypothetical protein
MKFRQVVRHLKCCKQVKWVAIVISRSVSPVEREFLIPISHIVCLSRPKIVTSSVILRHGCFYLVEHSPNKRYENGISIYAYFGHNEPFCNLIALCFRGPLLWSSGQSSWLQIRRPGFDSRRYQIFWEVVGLERGPLSLVSTTDELLDRKVAASV